MSQSPTRATSGLLCRYMLFHMTGISRKGADRIADNVMPKIISDCYRS